MLLGIGSKIGSIYLIEDEFDLVDKESDYDWFVAIIYLVEMSSRVAALLAKGELGQKLMWLLVGREGRESDLCAADKTTAVEGKFELWPVKFDLFDICRLEGIIWPDCMERVKWNQKRQESEKENHNG